MKPAKQILGKKGEQAAVDYLIKNNYQIIARNYRYRKSEIDIICQKENTLIFCEVKSYQSKPLDAAEFRINKKKQEQIILGAYGFLNDHPQYENMDIRFVDSNFVGKRYYNRKENVILIYDKNGFIAGIQLSVREKAFF